MVLKKAVFLGLSIQDKTNVILIVVEEHHVNHIFEAVTDACHLEEPGNGIILTLSIDKVAGLSKQIKKIRENLNNQQL